MIGVLALQGNYAAHQKMLESLGAEVMLIRRPEQLVHIDGLVMPGGESTSLLKLMAPLNFGPALQAFAKTHKILATCAGMILAAKHTEPKQQSLNLIDITVQRNAYGRQRDSHIVEGQLNTTYFKQATCPMVLIRAPKITRVGPKVTVLATIDDHPVMVQQGSVIALSFHPELTEDASVHRYFLEV